MLREQVAGLKDRLARPVARSSMAAALPPPRLSVRMDAAPPPVPTSERG